MQIDQEKENLHRLNHFPPLPPAHKIIILTKLNCKIILFSQLVLAVALRPFMFHHQIVKCTFLS